MATEYVKIVKHWVGAGNLVAYQVGFCNPFIYQGDLEYSRWRMV